jgi:putative DNA primase/helicase
MPKELAADCEVAKRRFEEDKDSPLSAAIRVMLQKIRRDVEEEHTGKTDAVSQQAISTDLDDFHNYINERLGGSARGPFDDFGIELDTTRLDDAGQVFLFRLFWDQNTSTLIHYGKEYMQWERNAYRKIEDAEIRKKLFFFLDTAKVKNKDGSYKGFHTTRARINEILDLLKIRISQTGKDTPSWVGKSTDKPASVTDPSLLIFGKTKILNLATKETLPPSPHWFNLAALDYDYDPKAKCPQWDKFLDSILGSDEESKKTIMEFMGLCLTTITKFQKALFIKGPKRGGKGTIAYIMEQIVGEHNVVPQLMSDFVQDFGLETFVGKTLVAVSDARVDKRKLAGTAEKILGIVGEDLTKINQKRKKALGVRLQTKLLFLSNMLLTIPDPSGVLPSRFIYVKLTKSFSGHEDPDLKTKLRAELPGILNSAIRHLQELLARGKFIQPKSGEVLYERMMKSCSPISEFALELEPYSDEDTIWEKWCEFCEDEGQNPGRKKSDLWEALEALGYNCDFEAARILKKIRELGGKKVPADKLHGCGRKFKKGDVLDKKLDEMVELGLLTADEKKVRNHPSVKVYSIKTD